MASSIPDVNHDESQGGERGDDVAPGDWDHYIKSKIRKSTLNECSNQVKHYTRDCVERLAEPIKLMHQELDTFSSCAAKIRRPLGDVFSDWELKQMEEELDNMPMTALFKELRRLLRLIDETSISLSQCQPLKRTRSVKVEKSPSLDIEPKGAKRQADDTEQPPPNKRQHRANDATPSTNTTPGPVHDGPTSTYTTVQMAGTPGLIYSDCFKSTDMESVYGMYWIIQHSNWPGKFFIIQCDRSDCLLPTKNFKSDPFANNLAKKHFNHKDHWHGSKSFSEDQIICLFGYVVVGCTTERARESNLCLVNQAAEHAQSRKRKNMATTRLETRQARRRGLPVVEEADMGLPGHSHENVPPLSSNGVPDPRRIELPSNLDAEQSAIDPALLTMCSEVPGDSVTVASDGNLGTTAGAGLQIWDIPQDGLQ